MSEDLTMTEAKAHAEGVFQGKVLTALENLDKKLNGFDQQLVNVIAELKAKAPQTALDKIEAKVDWMMKVLWMGLGGLAAAQALVGYLLSNV